MAKVASTKSVSHEKLCSSNVDTTPYTAIRRREGFSFSVILCQRIVFLSLRVWEGRRLCHRPKEEVGLTKSKAGLAGLAGLNLGGDGHELQV